MIKIKYIRTHTHTILCHGNSIYRLSISTLHSLDGMYRIEQKKEKENSHMKRSDTWMATHWCAWESKVSTTTNHCIQIQIQSDVFHMCRTDFGSSNRVKWESESATNKCIFVWAIQLKFWHSTIHFVIHAVLSVSFRF